MDHLPLAVSTMKLGNYLPLSFHKTNIGWYGSFLTTPLFHNMIADPSPLHPVFSATWLLLMTDLYNCLKMNIEGFPS
jgi:hypothetical protein